MVHRPIGSAVFRLGGFRRLLSFWLRTTRLRQRKTQTGEDNDPQAAHESPPIPGTCSVDRLCWTQMKPQERADRLRTFQREFAELEREKVLELTPEQRARLDAHLERTLAGLAAQFDVDTTEAQR